MTEAMTDPAAVLDRLDELHAAATPGPWTAATAPAEGSEQTHAEYLTDSLRPDEGRPLWVAWAPLVEGLHHDPDDAYVVPVVTGDGPTSEANAAWVAAVHDAYPLLSRVVRDIAALADELEQSPGLTGQRHLADRIRTVLTTLTNPTEGDHP